MVKTCKVIYKEIEGGFEGVSTNYSFGKESAENVKELTNKFRAKTAVLLGVEESLVSVQIDRVRNL